MSIVESLQRQSEIMQLPLSNLVADCARMGWLVGGRRDQMPPDGFWTDKGIVRSGADPALLGQAREDWFFWLMMAGRGAGKTRAGAEDTWWFAWSNPGCRIAVIGPTSDDCRKVCFEGESGLIACIPPQLIQSWNRGEKIITLVNGSLIMGYSADEPDRLRGPQHHRAWCDELAAWRYLDATLDNLLMGLRLGSHPRIVATTTPRPIKRLKEIVADPSTRVDTVSTYANMENLPRLFREKILKRYEGTRLGRQEISAELLEDNPGALWQRSVLDDRRVAGIWKRGVIVLDDGARISLRRVVVAVDPSTTNKEGSDETGIVVVGIGDDGRGYVLDDLSMSGSPAEWGSAAVRAYDDFCADRIIYEANQGGDMVANTITTSARAMREAGQRDVDFVPVSPTWASRGKVTRAEPVSALYEQGRISHLGCHARLEDQMCEFTSDFDRDKMQYSPDRVDALVWACTHLFLEADDGTNVQDFYRQEHSSMVERMRQSGRAAPSPELVALIPPSGVGSATGMMGHMYVVDPAGLLWVRVEDIAPLVRAGYRMYEDAA